MGDTLSKVEGWISSPCKKICLLFFTLVKDHILLSFMFEKNTLIIENNRTIDNKEQYINQEKADKRDGNMKGWKERKYCFNYALFILLCSKMIKHEWEKSIFASLNN